MSVVASTLRSSGSQSCTDRRLTARRVGVTPWVAAAGSESCIPGWDIDRHVKPARGSRAAPLPAGGFGLDKPSLSCCPTVRVVHCRRSSCACASHLGHLPAPGPEFGPGRLHFVYTGGYGFRGHDHRPSPSTRLRTTAVARQDSKDHSHRSPARSDRRP